MGGVSTVKEASVHPWPLPACPPLYITPVLQLDEWGSVWAGAESQKQQAGGLRGGGPGGQKQGFP